MSAAQGSRKMLSILIFSFILAQTSAVLNLEDELFDGREADRFDWSNHPCHRICGKNEPPKLCYYVFVVEMYSTMSKACYDCPRNLTDCSRPHCIPADGIQKSVYTVNRQMPGPTIEVCRNDKIVVDVRNTMLSESTTIHWHGFKQYGTPYMDGVPYVTQCPILPGQTFRYEFNATIDGTFFWHSHIGNQRVDGLFGALVVHPSYSHNYHKKLYDYDDQMMIVNDWAHLDGDSGEIKQYHDRLGSNPDTLLVNGLGRFGNFRADNATINTPFAVFTVSEKKRHRFRMIGAGGEDCPIEMSIDNHTLLLVSLDSSDIQPVEVDVITIWPGERVDFILKANQEPGNYWIRLRGFGLCSFSRAFQVAILNYEFVPVREPLSPIGYELPVQGNQTRVFNPFQTGTESSPLTNVNVPLLNSMAPNDKSVLGPVDQQIYINFDFYPKDNYDFHRKGLYGYFEVPEARRIGTFQFNHISLKLPNFPLLSQYDLIKPGSLCNSSSIPSSCDGTRQCACTHVIEVKLDSVVELVFVDEGRYAVVNHPLHLHGQFFRVVSQVNLEGNVTIDRVKQLDRDGKIIRRLDKAPLKDTIKAPGGGYTIVRFHAENPGYWFFHCHFEQHANIGMAFIFKVGEHNEFPPKPKNFPTCGNFVPPPVFEVNHHNDNNVPAPVFEVNQNIDNKSSLSNKNSNQNNNVNNNNNVSKKPFEWFKFKYWWKFQI